MSWWTPNIDQNFTFYEKARFILLWRYSLIFITTLPILALLNLDLDIRASIIFSVLFCIAVFALYFLHKFKRTQPMFWLFIISASSGLIYSMYSLKSTLHYSDFVWILCIILLAFIGVKYIYALIIVGVYTSVIAHFIFFELNEHLASLHIRNNAELISLIIEILLAFIIMCTLIDQNIKFQSYSFSELKKTNEILERRNQENVTLLKEIHHRVKNNLQIVVSLLRLQREKQHTNSDRDALGDAIKRVMSISLIHNKLYSSNELSKIMFDEYVRSLIDEISSFHLGTKQINLDLNNEIENVELNAMIPLGLIINELLTNSIKHSPIENASIDIKMTFKITDEKLLQFTYVDNGVWRDKDQSGLGLELIDSLSDQLEGEIEREGSQFELKFKI